MINNKKRIEQIQKNTTKQKTIQNFGIRPNEDYLQVMENSKALWRK